MDIGQWISKVFFQINKMLLTICKLMRAIWKKTEWEKTIQRYYQYKKSLVVNSNNQNQKRKKNNKYRFGSKQQRQRTKLVRGFFLCLYRSLYESLVIVWLIQFCFLIFSLYSYFVYAKKKNIHSNFRFSLWCLSSIHSK